MLITFTIHIAQYTFTRIHRILLSKWLLNNAKYTNCC